MTAILTRVRWNLNIILIFICFVPSYVEYFFMYLLVICTNSENCLLYSFAHLLTELLVLLEFSFLSSLYIVVINLSSEV
jgi:hypothetical protein